MSLFFRLSSLTIVALAFSVSAHALPGGNRLVSPDSVKLLDAAKLEIRYTLPCQTDDSSSVVMASDDTGDREVAVGVVASLDERNCKSGPLKSFKRTVNPKDSGYDCAGGECSFRPMPVEGQDDRKLEAYVRTRLNRAVGGQPTVQSLINQEAGSTVPLQPESLRCMGYPSWEGSGKAVGSCHLDAVGAGAKRRYAVLVSDDTEHPGEHRGLKVVLVSYSL